MRKIIRFFLEDFRMLAVLLAVVGILIGVLAPSVVVWTLAGIVALCFVLSYIIAATETRGTSGGFGIFMMVTLMGFAFVAPMLGAFVLR